MLSTVPQTAAAPPAANSSASQASVAMPTAQDFLQILLAEVKNQDPTSPTDPTQYISEMTGFSQLQQLSEMNAALSSMLRSNNSLQSSAAFIGRQVTAQGSSIGVAQGNASSIVFTPAAAGDYQAVITDSAGRQVDSVKLTVTSAGVPFTFSWEPPSGTADGIYTVTVLAPGGTPVSGLNERGAVKSIQLVNGAVVLDLGGGLTVPISAVSAIGA